MSWITRNIGVKFGALVLAVVFVAMYYWGQMTTNRSYHRQFQDVEVRMLGSQYVFNDLYRQGVGEIRINPDKIDVVVEGSKETIENLKAKDVKAYVDVAELDLTQKEKVQRVKVLLDLPEGFQPVPQARYVSVIISSGRKGR
jgi:hypothetical protein